MSDENERKKRRKFLCMPIRIKKNKDIIASINSHKFGYRR